MKLSLERLRHSPSVTSLGVTCAASGASYVRDIVPFVDRIISVEDLRKHIWEYDRVIFGGGGTVFEYRRDLSLSYMLKKKVADYLNFGRAFKRGTRYASIGLGIGPFADERGKKIAMNKLSYHDLVLTRDPTSHGYAMKAGVKSLLSHDLSFLELDTIKAIQKRGNPKDTEFCFIVRHFKYGEFGNRYLSALVKLAKNILDQGSSVRWLSFQSEYDLPVIRELESQGFEVWAWSPESMAITDAYDMISGASRVVTARMHGTYVAGMLGIPTVSIGVHPKLKFASDYFSDSLTVAANCEFDELQRAFHALTTSTEYTDKSPRLSADQAHKELQKAFELICNWIASPETAHTVESSG